MEFWWGMSISRRLTCGHLHIRAWQPFEVSDGSVQETEGYGEHSMSWYDNIIQLDRSVVCLQSLPVIPRWKHLTSSQSWPAVQQLAAWQEGCCMAASLNSRIKVASGELHERGEFCRLYDCLGNIKDSAGANMCKHRVFWNWLTTSNISCRYNAHDTLIDMHIYI